MNHLQLENVTASLGGNRVLNQVSIDTSAGELSVICGPNGAGKSSLLRAIAGLIPLETGKVVLDGEQLSGLSAHNIGRKIAYLPQGQTVHWPLTVEAITRLGRQNHLSGFGKSTGADNRAVEEALEKTGMVEFRSRPITQLSGGERARALLSRLIASDADVYLVDEPLAALDPYYQISLLEVLRLAADDGRIVVTVVHDLSVARRYFDKAFLMHHGRVIDQGAASDVIAPDNIRKAYSIKATITPEGGVDVTERLAHTVT